MSEEKKQEAKREELSKEELEKVAGGMNPVDGVTTEVIQDTINLP